MFKFNVKTFDADANNPKEFAKKLYSTTSFIGKDKDGNAVSGSMGTVMVKKVLINNVQGATDKDYTEINANGADKSHNEAHEIAHVFLNYDPKNNPGDPDEKKNIEQHRKAGGIFVYEEKDKNDDVTTPTQGVNQQNVNQILQAVPQTTNVTTVTAP